jgi:uncharacterized protein YigE (DUF2233 family)
MRSIKNRVFVYLALSFALIVVLVSSFASHQSDNSQHPLTSIDSFVTYIVDPKLQELNFYWKDDTGAIIRSIENLMCHVEGKNSRLLFAANGGMFLKDNSPEGLYIENFSTLTPLDTSSGTDNFYMKPNGVFYITADNQPMVCQTSDFTCNNRIKHATQSGPMLLINGMIHPAFTCGSSNLHIRNGVGILPDNRVVFVMSKVKVNFYDFASYFLSLGCKNALYLDGFVSRTYAPEQLWMQMDGDFGVMIGVTEAVKLNGN